MRYRLVCKNENEIIIRELFKANSIILDTVSAVILCEHGIDFQEEFDIIIYFRLDKIDELLKILQKERSQKISVLTGKNEEDYVPIDINEVVFFNAFGNDTYANMADGKKYKIKYKLYELERDLLTKRFIRINKSEIVNIRYVIRITPMFKGKLLLKLAGFKEPVDVSRNFTGDFKERIGM